MDSIINIINQYSIFIIIGLSIITLLLFIMTMILLSSVNKLEKKYRKMMRGVNNKNLEEAFITTNRRLNTKSRVLEIL